MVEPLYPLRCLLAQASQHLWLVNFDDVYREFTSVHHTIHPAPSPPDAGRYTVPSRFGCQSGDCGYRVRRLCTGRYLPAHLRRILLMEQQVWSIQLADNQPCDLVSQLPLNSVESEKTERRRVREAGLLPSPALRTGREGFPSSSSSI